MFSAAAPGQWVAAYPLGGLRQLAPTAEPLPDRTLLYADEPEEVPGPGIIYQDVVSNTPLRVVAEAVNRTAEPMQFGVLVEALTQVVVRQQRVGVGQNSNAFAAGWLSSWGWLQAAYDSWGLPVGGRRLLTWTAPAPAATFASDGKVVRAYAWALLWDAALAGQARVTVLAMRPGGAIPRNVLASHHVTDPYRGTFHHADASWSVAGVSHGSELRIATPGEYLPGHSAVDDMAVTLKGNYGVAYRITLGFTEAVTMGLSPSAGGFAGSVATLGLGGVRVPIGRPAKTAGGWEYVDLHPALPSGALPQASLIGRARSAVDQSFLFVPPPASSLPTQFVFDNTLPVPVGSGQLTLPQAGALGAGAAALAWGGAEIMRNIDRRRGRSTGATPVTATASP